MTVVLILCDGGRRVWARTNGSDVVPLDRVALREGDTTAEGVVLVASGQLLEHDLQPPALVTARLGHFDGGDDLATLPGANLPPLMSRVRSGGVEGQVMLLEPAERRVHIASGAHSLSVAAEEVTHVDE